MRDELGEQLDAGASEAFAVADHQVAHVYVKRPERVAEVAALLARAGRRGAVWTATEQARARPRSPALGRDRRDQPGRPLVHLLLLARRRPGARLRPHRRHPPQARLRPGRAVRRSDASRLPGLKVGLDPAEAKARLPQPDGRDPAGRGAGAGLARAAHRRSGRRPAVHHQRGRPAARRAPRSHATEVKDLVLRHLFGR